MAYKKLSEILSDTLSISKAEDRNISGLAVDSRKVQPGDLFIACCGAKCDARDYIDAAIKNGAVAVICEDKTAAVAHKQNVPIFNIPELRHKVGEIAARFYDHPSQNMHVIGVTGTNGKTSITQFLAKVLSACGMKCGVIGTIGMGFPDKLSVTANTTPDPIILQQQLSALKASGAKAVAMEVSSHGLDQDRVAGIKFTGAIFTNLTRDHLDYHKDMENYFLAKRKLFLQPGLQYGVINYDDDYGRRLIDEFRSKLSLYAFSTREDVTAKNELKVPIILSKNLVLGDHGVSADLFTPWGECALKSKLLGRFNVSNLLAVLAASVAAGIKLHAVLAELATLEPPPGRMQSFGGGNKPLVVVDYAHTPDALEQALIALREHCDGALWCVFGCGGERDRGKRPLMGEIAERYSDHIIITDDNPRSEDPKQIVDDVLPGLLHPEAAIIEHDRAAAIAYAVERAKANDVILVAGKGHEDYQIIGDTKSHFDDREIVKQLLIVNC